MVFGTLPTAGLPFYFNDWDDYNRLIDCFISTGTIETIREIWWDVRPHPDFGTIEIRICDTPATVADALGIAALIQALVARLCLEYERGMPCKRLPFHVIRQNKWRASSYGLDGEFIIEAGDSTVKARDALGELITSLFKEANELGCGHMIPGMGVMLNNMLGEEDINPHGFHALLQGTRMSSMMAPTIVMRGDVPEVVLGSGGSNRIRNAILQVIVNLLDHGLSVIDAVNEPRVHWDRAAFQAEKGVEASALDLIERSGVPVNRWHDRNMYFGGVHTVVMAGERPSGAGDSRRGGVCRT